MQLNVTLFLSLPVAYMAGRSTLYSLRAALTLNARVTSATEAPMTFTRMTAPYPLGMADDIADPPQMRSWKSGMNSAVFWHANVSAWYEGNNN